MHKLFVIIALVVLTSVSAFAGTGLAFLEIPVGARESALGGAGVALVTGPTSAAYNPASTAFTKRSVAIMLNRHFADTRAQYLGFTLRRGRLAITPHYWGTRVSDLEFRDQASRDPISSFDAISSAAGVALGWKLSERFAVGATGRYLYQKIHVEASDGWALDGGVMARDLVPHLTLGLAAQHYGHMSRFVSEEPTLPTTLRAGAAYEKSLGKPGTLLVTAEGQAVKENTPIYHAGIEYRAPEYVALRAGFVEGLEAQQMSFGFGLFLSSFRLDYAFVPYREGLGEGHRFSVGLDL